MCILSEVQRITKLFKYETKMFTHAKLTQTVI